MAQRTGQGLGLLAALAVVPLGVGVGVLALWEYAARERTHVGFDRAAVEHSLHLHLLGISFEFLAVAAAILGAVAVLVQATRRADPACARAAAVMVLDEASGTVEASLGRALAAVDLGYAALLVAVAPVSLAADLVARGFALPRVAGLLLALAALTWTVLLAGRLARATSLTMEPAGVAIASRWGRRWVPYGRLAGVAARGDDVVLSLHGGGAVVLAAGALDGAQRALLVDRLGARVAAPPDAAEAARYEALDRAGRSFSQWRAALAALVAVREGYREASITRADLVRALESPWTPAERRIGAALALAAEDPGAAARIRVAAVGCEDRRVGAALDAIASGAADEAVVERALRGTASAGSRAR